VSAAAVARAEADLEERHTRPSEPAEAREEAQIASLVIETLEALPKLPDKESLDVATAVTILRALWQELELPDNVEDIPIPGTPKDRSDPWTAELLRNSVELYAGAAGMAPGALLQKCILSAFKHRDEAEEKERDLVEQGKRWKLLLERESRREMLLEPNVLDKVARYESNLERSFFRTLHEIQELQASRL
jgi:hypothetical protein